MQNIAFQVWQRIEEEYFVHMIVDNLPVATQFQMPDTKEMQYEPGFRLGFSKSGKMAINNHLRFIMSYHVLEDDPANPIYRVVGFRVETASVDKASYTFNGDECSFGAGHEPQVVAKDGPTSLHFTYSIHWERSNVRLG